MSLNGVRQWPVMSSSTLFIHGCARTTREYLHMLMLWKQRLVCTRILPGNHTCICRDIERPRWVRSTLANRTYRVHPVRVCNCNRSLSQYRGAITGKLFLRRREECFPLFTGSIYWSRAPLTPAERLNLTKLFAFFLHKPEVFLR
jgi:hypothetical protein